jgi:hypothetical protein
MFECGGGVWSSHRKYDIRFGILLVWFGHFLTIFEQLHYLQPSIQRNMTKKNSPKTYAPKGFKWRLMQKECTCSQIHSPLQGDKVDNGVGLSYWSVTLHKVNFIPPVRENELGLCLRSRPCFLGGGHLRYRVHSVSLNKNRASNTDLTDLNSAWPPCSDVFVSVSR